MDFNITEASAPIQRQQPAPLTLYLCGPIAGRSNSGCMDWREWVKQNWPGRCLDPLRRDYRGQLWTQDQAELVVHDDLGDIDQSHGLIVYYDRPSVGTSMEIFYAANVLRKPVFLINVSGLAPCNLSPWLLHHVCGIAEKLEPEMLADIEHEIRRRLA